MHARDSTVRAQYSTVGRYLTTVLVPYMYVPSAIYQRSATSIGADCCGSRYVGTVPIAYFIASVQYEYEYSIRSDSKREWYRQCCVGTVYCVLPGKRREYSRYRKDTCSDMSLAKACTLSSSRCLIIGTSLQATGIAIWISYSDINLATISVRGLQDG